MIDTNKNIEFSEQDDESTVELEQLSEAALVKFEHSDESSARPESVSEVTSEVQELREELKFRVELNGILQNGIDQLRAKCDGRAAQIASLEDTSKKVSFELEQSQRQLEDTLAELAKARENEQALLAELKELRDAGVVTADQFNTAEKLRSENRLLMESADELAAELTTKAAVIDSYERDLAELRSASSGGESIPSDETSAPRSVSDSQVEECWVLVGLDSDASGVHVIRDGIVTIGSGPDSDIQIESKFVSRHHAQLIDTRRGCVLDDLNSTNGTFINSRRVVKRVLKEDDVVTIGKHRFRFEKRTGR